MKADPSGKAMREILAACEAKPNGMRKRLSRQSVNQIISKYENKASLKN